MAAKGIAFNIQHYTIHDGPGIRTEIFLKGCPLRCPWCSNPEGQVSRIQPGVYQSKCLGMEVCGLCMEVCQQSALLFEAATDVGDAKTGSGAEEGLLNTDAGKKSNRLIAIDRNRCMGCMACVQSCPADAIRPWGVRMTAEEAMREIRRDKGYYDRSGGGVTVSGGEALLQADFVAELFQACRDEGIHTCCESTLAVKWETVEKVLPWTDLFITDIKHMDSETHRGFSGVGNERILENQRRLIRAGKEMIVRIPVIPEVNDDQENIEATADFILNDLEGKIRTLQLLSFMRLGEEKYRSLGMPYRMAEVQIDRAKFQERVNGIAEYCRGRGIHCMVGSREKE